MKVIALHAPSEMSHLTWDFGVKNLFYKYAVWQRLIIYFRLK